jgi:hypothetical protein
MVAFIANLIGRIRRVLVPQASNAATQSRKISEFERRKLRGDFPY